MVVVHRLSGVGWFAGSNAAHRLRYNRGPDESRVRSQKRNRSVGEPAEGSLQNKKLPPPAIAGRGVLNGEGVMPPNCCTLCENPPLPRRHSLPRGAPLRCAGGERSVRRRHPTKTHNHFEEAV